MLLNSDVRKAVGCVGVSVGLRTSTQAVGIWRIDAPPWVRVARLTPQDYNGKAADNADAGASSHVLSVRLSRWM